MACIGAVDKLPVKMATSHRLRVSSPLKLEMASQSSEIKSTFQICLDSILKGATLRILVTEYSLNLKNFLH